MIIDSLNTPEKFNNPYVTYLAIMDHLNEIVLIDTEFKRYKNSTVDQKQLQEIKEANIKTHFENELADLFILLNKHFKDDEVVRRRLEKFWAKDNQAKETLQ